MISTCSLNYMISGNGFRSVSIIRRSRTITIYRVGSNGRIWWIHPVGSRI